MIWRVLPLLRPVRVVAFVLIMALGVVSTHVPTAAIAQSVQFSRVDVAGNVRIEAETIRVFSGLQPGQPASAQQINNAVQRLFDTGLFEDVQIAPSGGVIVITVVENPTINLITFEGNSRVEDEILNQVITLEPRQAFNRSAAERDAQAILEVYSRQGRFGARVEPKIIRLEDNRVNLVYEIMEGRLTQVQRIAFVGNDVFSDRRLRRVIETSQSGFLSRIFGGATYDPDRLEFDQQQLREFYLDRGFVDFEIQSASAELAREQNGFFVSFRLSEGERYSYGNLSVNSTAAGLDPDEFETLIDLRPGKTYNASRVDRVIERMAFLAGQKGFAFVEIVPRLVRDTEARTVDIEFDLIEGPRVFIERIDIRGNRETVDRVIRRQFRVVEGDAFNSRELRRAEGRIRALGFFDEVEVRVREGATPDRAIISVDVEEAQTGSLNFGGAFSSSDGVVGNVGLTERNFLGRGQTVSLDFSGGSSTTNLAFSFLEPALFDQDLSAGFSVFFRERELDESSIDTDSVGFIPTLGFPLSEDSRLTLRMRISEDNFDVIGTQPLSLVLQNEPDSAITLSAGFNYTLDRRNSPVDPTAGFILQFDQDFAGLADVEYSRSRVDLSLFASLFEEDLVLNADFEAGALIPFNGESRVNDRFRLGGDSFRGFEPGGIGPRDMCENCFGPLLDQPVDDTLGGELFAVARFEASFPIGLPEELGVFGGVFFDVGSVWSLSDTDGSQGVIDDSAQLRTSIGVSLFWDTAIGPLRFNLAQPLASVAGDEFEQFRITVDTRF